VKTNVIKTWGDVCVRLSRFAQTCEPAISTQERSKHAWMRLPQRCKPQLVTFPWNPLRICDGSVIRRPTFVMFS
jgi:hypothetical protein